MKAIANPVEPGCYIITSTGPNDYIDLLEWLTDSGIQYKIISNLIWFADDESELMFVMRWA